MSVVTSSHPILGDVTVCPICWCVVPTYYLTEHNDTHEGDQ